MLLDDVDVEVELELELVLVLVEDEEEDVLVLVLVLELVDELEDELVLVDELVDELVLLVLVEDDVEDHVKSSFPNRNSDILAVFCYDYTSAPTLRPSVQRKVVLYRKTS